MIPTNLKPKKPHGKPWKYDQSRPGNGHGNQSARPWDKELLRGRERVLEGHRGYPEEPGTRPGPCA